MTGNRVFLTALLIIMALTLAACGSDSEDDSNGGSSEAGTEESGAPLATVSPGEEAGSGDVTAEPSGEGPAVSETTGMITGEFNNTTGPMPDDISVWTVKVRRSPEGYGIFALNTQTTPYFRVETSGKFETGALEPAEYVLIVGNSPENAVAILGEDGQAKPFELLAGEVLDVGKYAIALPLSVPIEDQPTQGYPEPLPTEEYVYP